MPCILYPQNGDRIVAIDSVTSLHRMYPGRDYSDGSATDRDRRRRCSSPSRRPGARYRGGRRREEPPAAFGSVAEKRAWERERVKKDNHNTSTLPLLDEHITHTSECVLRCQTYREVQYLHVCRSRSRVVSVLDLGAEGPGFKSQSRRCRVTVLGKLFTPTVPLFICSPSSETGSSRLKGCEGNYGPGGK